MMGIPEKKTRMWIQTKSSTLTDEGQFGQLWPQNSSFEVLKILNFSCGSFVVLKILKKIYKNKINKKYYQVVVLKNLDKY